VNRGKFLSVGSYCALIVRWKLVAKDLGKLVAEGTVAVVPV